MEVYRSPIPPQDATRFILLGTQHPGNVGAAARAMRVMGFSDLVLVAPRSSSAHRHPKAVALASGALDVLSNARIAPTLTDALDGVTYLCATAMTPRDFGPPTFAPRPLFQELAGSGHRVGFVFGSERTGLTNADVYRCDACLSIPANPAYGSLNLAQAVQVIAYEWREALGGFDVVPRTVDAARATTVEVEGLIDHWGAMLEQIGFLDPRAPKKLLARLRRLASRSQLRVDEVRILRGIAAAVSKAHF